MFARVAVFLLLLLLNVLFVESSGKIHGSLKNVGKRQDYSIWRDIKKFRDIMRADDVVNVERDRKQWVRLNDDAIRAKKDLFAQRLVNRFVEASSEEHEYYKESLEWIESILSDDLQVEICGSPDKMNRIQYTKFLEKEATKYVNVSETTLKQYELVVTPEKKKEMKVYMIFMQEDKNGIKTFIKYDLDLNLTFARPLLDMPFSITKISQGAKCKEHTDSKYKSNYNTVDRLGDIVEDLASHPTPQSYFKLFAPRVTEITEEPNNEEPYVHNLPVIWLNHFGIGSILTIYHPEGAEFLGCDEKTFNEWYEKFGMMWHPVKGDGHPMKMEVKEMLGKMLIVEITMPLQIGTNETAKIHNWILKTYAELLPNGRWEVGSVGFLPPVHKSYESLMDESYLAYQEVLGNVFSHYLSDKKIWYLATDFIRHFIKKNDKEFKVYSCKAEVKKQSELSKVFMGDYFLWNSTMEGFFIKNQLEPLPAQEEMTVTLRVMMRPPKKLPKNYVFGSDWKFYIRWDNKIQFYYVYLADFSCPQAMSQETGEWGFYRTLPSPRRKNAEHGSHE